MDTPGKLLKIRREEQGKLLEDFSRLLKIRYDYLKAIEDEDYQLIPGEVFIKGYMRIYANALGFDSDHVLDLYKKQIAATPLIEQTTTPKKTSLCGALSKNIAPFTYKPVAIITAVVLVVSLSILFTMYKYQSSNVTPHTKIFDVGVKMGEKVKEPLSAPNVEPKMFSLEIIAIEETWVSISVDKVRNEQRLLKAGEVVRWTASEGFSIKIGNAAGAKLVFNGKHIGDLGPHGKVVRLILPKDTS